MVESHKRDASHSCPFWQPSCAFRWSAPDGPKRLPRSPLRSPSRGYFYKLRASRSVVVNLSLSRRNVASESKERAAARCSWFVSPHHHTRRGCDGISLADSPRASPYEQGLPSLYAAWAPCIWYGYCMMPVAMARAASSRWAS